MKQPRSSDGLTAIDAPWRLRFPPFPALLLVALIPIIFREWIDALIAPGIILTSVVRRRM